MVRTILTFALCLASTAMNADDKKAVKPKVDPEGTPLELSITGKATYPHDLIGYATPAEYREAIDVVAKGKRKLPRPPFVDLAVEVKNTSNKPLKVWTKGDPVVLTLNLKGKGAINIDPPLAFTQEFRIPEAVEIAAGKSHKIELTSLTSGHRMASHYSYWTEPGEHELVATLKTGVSPSPKGAKVGMDGFGLVTLTSAPFKLTVEEKK
jgi:hypothetical protein